MENFAQIAELWKKSNYIGRQTAIKTLPVLTGYSPQMIEYVMLQASTSMDTSVFLKLLNFSLKPEAFYKFVSLENANSMIKAYASFSERLKQKRKYQKMKNV